MTWETVQVFCRFRWTKHVVQKRVKHYSKLISQDLLGLQARKPRSYASSKLR